MDLKQMRYFLAVAEELNFGRAAQRLHIAQPPLTRHIKAIEEELGVQLFVRSAKGTELTEAGVALLAEVPNILSLAERAQERVQQAGNGFTGRLDVGIFTSGILDAIPRLLSTFHVERPQVRIGLHPLTKMQQIEALRERRITIGFNRWLPEEDDIVVETVLQEPYLVALYDGHPLCSREFIRLKDLAGEAMILYPSLPVYGLAQHVAKAFAEENVELVVEQEVVDAVTCIGLVASRFGICVTTASTSNLRLPGVVYKPLRSRTLRHLELNCLYRKDDSSPILQSFLQIVRQFRLASQQTKRKREP